MALAFRRRVLPAGYHRRLWLWLAITVTFLLAALWAQPID